MRLVFIITLLLSLEGERVSLGFRSFVITGKYATKSCSPHRILKAFPFDPSFYFKKKVFGNVCAFLFIFYCSVHCATVLDA